MFTIAGRDSDPTEVQAVLSRRAPLTGNNKPVVLLVLDDGIAKYDLLGKQESWRVPGKVSTHLAVAGNLVVHGAAPGQVIARSLVDGRKLWQQSYAGTILGIGTDGTYVSWVAQQGKTHRITVASADGRQLWQHETDARVGAAAVHRGQVFVPLLNQWLLVLDGATGKRLARVRAAEHQISFVRATRNGVTFGSRAGVYYFDERAAEAKSNGSWFATAKVPEAFTNAQYGFDGYDPVQAGYTAYDRNNRLLWRADSKAQQPTFTGNMVASHIFRFLFAFDQDNGHLLWAYSHPRYDLMASAHVGSVIGVVSKAGEIGALDIKSGKLRYLQRVKGNVRGAAFYAEGWSPTDPVTEILTPNTTTALSNIAKDRDKRFARVKKFALTAMANLGDSQALEDLVGVVTSGDHRPDVYDSAVKALINRRDPAVAPLIVQVLGKRFDHVAGSEPRGVAVLSRVVANLDPQSLDAKLRAELTAALLAHFEDPATTGEDLEALTAALVVVGTGPERAALRRFVLLHRADPRVLSGGKAMKRACHALARGAAPDRAVVRFVAGDPVTHPQVAREARAALVARDSQ
jgi:outer membrane protein assembly factor BamB